MRLPVCDSHFTETESSALNVRARRGMPSEDIFYLQAREPYLNVH